MQKMPWNNRIPMDPEQNRRSLAPIIWVVLAFLLACLLGVYFGLFMGLRLFGGG